MVWPFFWGILYETVLYIGEMVNFENSEDEVEEKDLDIKFYRKNRKVYKSFVESQVEDIHEGERTQIALVLPNAVRVGRCKRKMAALRFPVNLSCYHMR